MDRFEEGHQEGLEQRTRADHPRRHPVDAGVEEVEPEPDPVEIAAADRLLGDRLQLVRQRDDVIAVPSDAPADVQAGPRRAR